MFTSSRRAWIAAVIGGILFSAHAPAPLFAQATARASVTTGGLEGNDLSERPRIAGGGRVVVFASRATNLVAGDTNGASDIFARDLETLQTTRVSVGLAGAQANGDSTEPEVSYDGRYVAFTSQASNLVPGDTFGLPDVFVHDRLLGTTVCASVGLGGVEANQISGAEGIAISGDGRCVAFHSYATNLVAGDVSGYPDVFVRDLLSGTTALVSRGPGGVQANSASERPALSYGGRHVAFHSYASNLVAADTNLSGDVFVADWQAGTIERVSVDSSGAQADAGCYRPSLSADGRFVAFYGDATSLVPNDTNGVWDVFVRDRSLGTTIRASVDSSGIQASAPCAVPRISFDGRWVVFNSLAGNLVPGDTNQKTDVFVHDLWSAATTRASVSTAGLQGNNDSGWPSISADGLRIAFDSYSFNLVAGDTNYAYDVFVRELGVSSGQATSFCFGDGSGTACPCGNHSVPGSGEGCLSSLGVGGRLIATGLASLAADSLVLHGSQMPSAPALYFQGTSQAGGGAGIPFGDGLRCAGGTLIRLGTGTNFLGASHYPEPGDQPVSVRGLVTAPDVRAYQVWYRNAAPFCTASAFNLTNGLQVAWGT